MADLAPTATRPSRRDLARLLGGGAASAALAPLAARAQSAATPAPAMPVPAAPALLDSNESPYGPPESAVAAIAAAMARAARYPDTEADELVAALAAANGVPTDAIALGAGSSQLLHGAANAWSSPGARAVVAQPTFEALGRYAEARGAEVVRVPLAAGYRHDLAAMAAAAGERALLYLCNPNNPTATVTPAAEIRALLERLPPTVVVLLDEAYHEYALGEPGYESAVPWLARCPNLVVTRTFSKVYGLAGLRCGYALACPERIAELRRRLPWDSLSLAALVAATAALADTAFVERSRAANRECRATAARGLAALGAEVAPSAANFLFADLGSDVAPVLDALRARGIRVGRRFAALPTHLRVTIGTAEEMARFLAALGEVWTAARAA
jgi:histidinol-phosphate aminotransferase